MTTTSSTSPRSPTNSSTRSKKKFSAWAGKTKVDEEALKKRLLSKNRCKFATYAGTRLNRRKIIPDPWQKRLLDSDSKRVMLNCARQIGKSTVSGAIALHKAMFMPEAVVLVSAPSLRQAKILFAKITRYHGALGGIIDAPSVRRLGLELENGSVIEALPGNPDTVQGFSPDLVIIDEAARIKDDLYYGLRPSLAVTGGALMMLSTPAGKRGVFYEEWTHGEGWERYEVPATDCPRISAEFLEQERRSLPPWVYRQYYECSFEETEDAVFTHEMVEQAESADVAPLFAS